MTHKFEGVDYLVGCYFHQDWDIDGKDDKDIVDFFCSESDDSLILNVIESFSLFIEFYSGNKNGADRYFDKMSCGYYYEAYGITGYEWAGRLKVLLEKSLASKKCA